VSHFQFVAMEHTFKLLLQVIAADATNVVSSCHGSHVLRTLLCLCKGVPLDSLQNFHTTKRSAVLAERLNCGSNQLGARDSQKFENGFVDVFKSFVRQILHSAKSDIPTLCVDKNSSLVLQVSIIFLCSTSIILSIIFLVHIYNS
jgi:nucleolar protein 9